MPRPTRPEGSQPLGEVRWDGYQHWQMFNMVMDAHPSEVFARHRRWTEFGDEILRVNNDVQHELDTLLKYWRGGASATAAAASTRLLDWSQEAAEATQQIGQQLGDYGNALVRARNRMPQPRFIHAEAAVKDQGESVDVPPGAAGASLALQITSDYRADRQQREEAKQKAIDVMREFEHDAEIVRDRLPTYQPPTPVAKEVPDPPLPDGPDAPVPSPWPPDPVPPTPLPGWPPVPGPPDGSGGPSSTPGAGASPPGVGVPGGSGGPGYGSGPGGFGGVGPGLGTGAGADSGYSGRNFAGGPLPGGPLTGASGSGAGGTGSGGGTGALGRGAAGALGGSAAAAEAAAARGAAGGGATGAGMRGGGGTFYPPMAGAGREEDKEKRVAPYLVADDDLFDDDRPVAPPVFGA